MKAAYEIVVLAADSIAAASPIANFDDGDRCTINTKRDICTVKGDP